jgi:DHA1 family arabinose polymer transporter-like MFS transporter
MMITSGFGWNAIALPAALLSFLAMTSLLIYARGQRNRIAAGAVN